MRRVEINFTQAASPEQAHELIAGKLDFSGYYGANLDALYDCLTDLREELHIALIPPGKDDALAGWFERARRVFRDAEQENRHLEVEIMEGRKIAVLFPGIGYSCDRSLLYFSGKLAAADGYEILTVPYKDFPSGVKGNREKMVRSFEMAMEQTEEILTSVDWTDFCEIVFIAKSIGTIVSSAYAKQHGLSVRQVLFTPLSDTFRFTDAGCDAVAFHGTADPWAKTDEIRTACEENGIPLHLTDDANHSLETGDVMTDLDTLTGVMRAVKRFLRK